MPETRVVARPAGVRTAGPGRRRPPRALLALVCASLSLAVVWAFVTPSFQAPDEPAHFGYVQGLAETGTLPGDPARQLFSTEQLASSDASNYDQVAGQRTTKPEWSEAAFERWLRSSRAGGASQRVDGGGINPASSNPPLYYAIESVAYLAASDANLFGRLQAMRLLSLLWLAVTVSAAWLLAGEALGRDRLLQLAAGGLAGLAPMMSFVSSSVSPDAMLFALWTLALWQGVRILRRGLSTSAIALLFATVGLAIVVKATSYALLPGALFVLAVGLLRGGRLRLAPVAAAFGALALTAGAWFVVARLTSRAAAAQLSGAAGGALNVRELLSYVWQFYLPRLPFMTEFPTQAHTIPVYDTWFKGAWGAFGWTEIAFRNRVYILLAALTLVIVVAAGAQLWRTRRNGDWTVPAFLALVTVTLVAGLHWTEYHLIKGGAGGFNQGRYLLPLVGIAGLVVAVAIKRLAPARRAVAVAVVLGGLVALQLGSLELVLERFYA